MRYTSNFSDEKPPKRRQLLPEGWRQFTIQDMKESKSKSGNDMFVFTIRDRDTGYEEDIYALNVDGKKWFLGAILKACGITPNADGVMAYGPSDVIGKEVYGLVVHEPNEYINRKGETINTTQHRIVEIRKEGIAWDEPS